MNLLYVFLGGGVGAIARYGIGRWLPFAAGELPRATLLANILSCMVLGYLMGMLQTKGLEPRFQLLLMTGFCGGFSTFSTFSAETFELLNQGYVGLAFLYMALSMLSCLIGIWIGMMLAGYAS